MKLRPGKSKRSLPYPGPRRSALWALVAACFGCVAAGQEGDPQRTLSRWGPEFVPFVIPARLDPQQPIWIGDARPIRTDAPRLRAAGHFCRDEGAVRIWGVNLCFGANLPTHEDAPHIAQRLAAAGVNSVRCHHLDTARWPRGIWNARDGKTVEPQALDRLDYFINELAQRGIWVNLNLHVGRTHSEYLDLPGSNSEYDKVAGIFTPALIAAQKQYARDLLTHVNPYRQARWADDPALAFVEITNEDSFFMWDGERRLRDLPPYYAAILQGRFNDWLRHRYGSEQALRAAWGKDTQPLGQNLLRDGTFTEWAQGVPASWHVEQHEDCRASVSRPPGLRADAIQIKIDKANDTEWHLQFNQAGLPVTEGQYYVLSFEAASEQPRRITASVGQAHEPWGNLGLSRQADLGTEWKKFGFGFVATGSDKDARVSFAFGGNATTFSLARVALRPGGQTVLAEGESLTAGNVALFQEGESRPRTLDRLMFLAETEKAYFDDMRSYVKRDLGCGALVTGTIVFGPLGLYAQSDMDFIDTHAYWQHPRFPGRPWDPANWLIEQRAMTDHPDQATLFRLAAERLAGKPFTVSEYNHPAPLDAQAECVPLIASFAAAQDWDGVWLFTYSHATDDWGRETMSGFFDIDTNPAKWGFLRAGTAIFLHQGLAPLERTRTVQLAHPPGGLPTVAAAHLQHGSNMLSAIEEAGGVTYGEMMRSRVLGWVLDADSATASRPSEPVARPSSLHWSADQSGRGLYQAHGHLAHAYIGHAARFESETGGIRIASPEFVALTITALDRGDLTALEASRRILITACGRCENTDMVFSQDRRTVGRNWGKAPVQIEAVRGSIVLPRGEWTCHALAPDGSRKQQVPITYEEGRGTLPLSPEYGTMWYLLERQTK